MDNLVYTYNGGNQLQRVIDNVDNTLGFKQGSGNYIYDANGNMTVDPNKGLSDIKYNNLNLPYSITKGADKVGYIYDVAGRKFANILPANDTIFYSGSFVYRNGDINYMICSDGLLNINGSTTNYEFHLKDHLGNTRVAVNENNVVTQINNYYPFGLTFGQTGSSTNKYLYNGKELQEETGFIDFGARQLDKELGIWFNLDPLAEKFSHISPYVVIMNNPLNMLDFDGKQAWPIAKMYRGYRRIITSKYGMRLHPIKKIKKHHNGVDMDYSRNDLGAPIYATHDGKVVKISRKKTGGGNMIVIRSPDGSFQTFYCHLDKFAEGIKVGTKIKEGDQIGTMGNTGGSTGAHLHYGIKEKQKNGRYKDIDPMDEKGNLIDPQKRIDTSAEDFKLEMKANIKLLKSGEISKGEFDYRVADMMERWEDGKKK